MKKGLVTIWNYARTHFFSSCVIAACVWLVFFDQHSILAIHELNVEAEEMRKEIDVFKEKIEQYRQDINEVSGDADQREHFAREQLHMKKDNEDIFLIEE